MPKNHYIIKRLRAFKYAYRGIKHLFATEAHAQVQLLIAIGTFAAGFYFEISRLEWMMQLLATGLILSAEALNTAIEKLADFIQPAFHHKIGIIKDIAAGGVTFAAIAAFIIGILIYWPYISVLF